MVFDSARAALRCAMALQRRFTEAGFELGVGMGLDAGEAVPVQGGFRGVRSTSLRGSAPWLDRVRCSRARALSTWHGQ